MPHSFFASRPNNLILISAHPAATGNGVVLQMRETSGKADSIPVYDLLQSSTTLAVAMRAKSVTEINVLEEPVKVRWKAIPDDKKGYGPVWIGFRPYETKFILVGL
jgi:hypothetical protein